MVVAVHVVDDEGDSVDVEGDSVDDEGLSVVEPAGPRLPIPAVPEEGPETWRMPAMLESVGVVLVPVVAVAASRVGERAGAEVAAKIACCLVTCPAGSQVVGPAGNAGKPYALERSLRLPLLSSRDSRCVRARGVVRLRCAFGTCERVRGETTPFAPTAVGLFLARDGPYPLPPGEAERLAHFAVKTVLLNAGPDIQGQPRSS